MQRDVRLAAVIPGLVLCSGCSSDGLRPACPFPDLALACVLCSVQLENVWRRAAHSHSSVTRRMNPVSAASSQARRQHLNMAHLESLGGLSPNGMAALCWTSSQAVRQSTSACKSSCKRREGDRVMIRTGLQKTVFCRWDLPKAKSLVYL